MRRFLLSILGVLAGYLAGALLGFGLLSLAAPDAQSTALPELVTGPIGAVMGLIAAWNATDPARKARRKFDIRDRT